MARSKCAVLLVAGGLAFAGNAYVNPAAPRTAPNNVQYVSNTAGFSAAEEGVLSQEERSSWTGLFAGVTLGMIVGLAGGMNSASAMNYALPKPGEKPNDRVYAKDIARESRRGPSEGGSGSATGAGTMAPQDFDKNVDKALERRLAKFDVEEKFNGKEVLEQFQVDRSQMPKFEYAAVTQSDGTFQKNDPALTQKAPKVAQKPVAAEPAPVIEVPKLPEMPAAKAPAADAPAPAQKKAFSLFAKKAL